MGTPLLAVEGLQKRYRRSRFSRDVAFSLTAEFRIETPATVGVLGPNGSGKTTLFELITGSNVPTAGRVLVAGQNIHRVRYRERGRLAVHYHQSFQIRRIKRTMPSFLLERAARMYPIVHLFDEPQFNTQDGYIGFMLNFFRKLRDDGRVVFLCLHPTEPYHLDILRESCERFIFIRRGTPLLLPDYNALMHDEDVRTYLGDLAKRCALT
ncbi:MAG TPA: ATP-binding cassette domain-containing protein [Casimicrobiaceae bacterium]|jgi:ABC-type branched-subunit amino acid transport system ATPase component